MPIAWFHTIGGFDDRRSNKIIAEASEGRKYPHSYVVIPNYSDSINVGQIYYYQSPDTFYLKLLSDFLCLLAKIKANSKGSLYRSSLLGEEFVHETSLNFKRIIKYADVQNMFLFMDRTQRKYKNNKIIQMQFMQLLTFLERSKMDKDMKRLGMNVVSEHARWEKDFDLYLVHQVYNGRFDVDLYIYLTQVMIKHYNKCGYAELRKLKNSTQSIDTSVHNMTEITNNVINISESINVGLDYILDELLHRSDASTILMIESDLIQELATVKWILLNSIHVFNYLYHWMIEQKLSKDIEIFVEKQIIDSHYFKRYVIDSLVGTFRGLKKLLQSRS